MHCTGSDFVPSNLFNTSVLNVFRAGQLEAKFIFTYVSLEFGSTEPVFSPVAKPYLVQGVARCHKVPAFGCTRCTSDRYTLSKPPPPLGVDNLSAQHVGQGATQPHWTTSSSEVHLVQGCSWIGFQHAGAPHGCTRFGGNHGGAEFVYCQVVQGVPKTQTARWPTMGGLYNVRQNTTLNKLLPLHSACM